jgi:low affinity Fe/Cu permease
MLRHPVDRTEGDSRGLFDTLAEHASFVASSPAFFSVCLVVVVVWIVGLIAGASDRLESATVGVMAAMTLVLVALMKNAELRAERAVQHKLDAIAHSLLEKRSGNPGNADEALERAIGLHEQI